MTAYIADVIETGKTAMYIGSYLKDLGYKDVYYITSLILKGTAACISDKYIGSFSLVGGLEGKRNLPAIYGGDEFYPPTQ